MHRPQLAPCLRAAFALLALAWSANAEAQARDFSTVRFRPAVGPGNYLGLDGAAVQTRGARSYAVTLDYAADLLVADHPCRALNNVARCVDESVALVERTGLTHLLASMGVGARTQIALGLPVGASDTKPFAYWAAQPGLPSMYRELRPKNGFVLGDLRIAAKTRVVGDEKSLFGVAVTPFFTAPTSRLTSRGNCARGEHCTFMGERTLQAGVHGVFELTPHARFRAALLVGALYRPSRSFLGAEVGSELSYGAAARYAVRERLAVTAELQGAVELAGADDHPLEARGALAYGRDVVLTLGGGAGILRDVGSPTFRVFGGLQWTPTYRDADGDGLEDDSDRCPQQREDRDRFEDDDGCPDPDNDGDGVLDAADGCDDADEDRDGHQDDDGCPDPDNDGDGVLDGYDSCEGELEDLDGDRDDDGCPDLDRDRDGVPDVSDQCIDQAEDTDGLADQDGCPESDFDRDGFLDEADACPEQPGPSTGSQGDDGCPA